MFGFFDQSKCIFGFVLTFFSSNKLAYYAKDPEIQATLVLKVALNLNSAPHLLKVSFQVIGGRDKILIIHKVIVND